MMIFSIVIFAFSTLTLSPVPLCLEKWGSWPPSSYGSAAPGHTLWNHIKYGRSINRSRNRLKHLQIREKPKQNIASIVDLLENRNLEILSQKRGIVIESSQRSLPAYSLGPMQSEYNKLVRLIAVTVCGPANVNKTKDTTRPQGWRWPIIENRSFLFWMFARKTVVM